MPAITKDSHPPAPFSDRVIVGRDILELLSSAMYVDPLTIFREFIQNAADALDEAEEAGLFSDTRRPRVEITLDPGSRGMKIRDNGIGIPCTWGSRRPTSLGASKKRGTNA